MNATESTEDTRWYVEVTLDCALTVDQADEFVSAGIPFSAAAHIEHDRTTLMVWATASVAHVACGAGIRRIRRAAEMAGFDASPLITEVRVRRESVVLAELTAAKPDPDPAPKLAAAANLPRRYVREES